MLGCATIIFIGIHLLVPKSQDVTIGQSQAYAKAFVPSTDDVGQVPYFMSSKLVFFKPICL